VFRCLACKKLARHGKQDRVAASTAKEETFNKLLEHNSSKPVRDAAAARMTILSSTAFATKARLLWNSVGEGEDSGEDAE
jgi:hypothetical protein